MIRASISPGVLNDPTNPLTIRIHTPRRSDDAEIRLIEMDSWHFGRDTMIEGSGSGNSLIATFSGTIDRRRFQVESETFTETSSDAPSISLKFQGESSPRRVALPSSAISREGGEFELGLEFEARYRRGRREVTQQYRTRWPVFVRNFTDPALQQRLIITFLARKRDQYRQSAWEYWRPRSDALLDANSVEAILDALSNQAHLRALHMTAWGEINIVSHANINQWLFPLFRQNNTVNFIDENLLIDQSMDVRLDLPIAEAFDDNSRVVLRGCRLGTNQFLLNNIRLLFGGSVKIFAPKHIQYYGYDYRQGRRWHREYFLESYWFTVPGRAIPSFRICLQRLRDKYPDSGIDDREWRLLLRGTGERERHNKIERLVYPLPVEELPASLREQVMRRGSRHWSNSLRRRLNSWLRDNWPGPQPTYDTVYTDWRWVNPIRRGNYIGWRGIRRVVDVRRPMRDEHGNMVVPDLSNSDHYGRAPEW
ncbi:MAG: hypothetical protein JSW33_00170 [bacterium]|nr:MAG: hypothetical protein JSW33_00170 [bacterium]